MSIEQKESAFEVTKQIIEVIEQAITPRKEQKVSNNEDADIGNEAVNVEEKIDDEFYQTDNEILNKLIAAFKYLYSFAVKIINVFMRYIIFPVKSMFVGVLIWTRGVKYFLSFAIVSLIFFVYPLEEFLKLSFGSKIFEIMGIVAILLSALIVIYAIPSTYSTYQVRKSYIQKVKNVLTTNNVTTTAQIDVLTSNICILENKGKLRVKGLKAITAFGFGLSILLFKKSIDWHLIVSEGLNEWFWHIALLFFCFYILTDWYSKVTNLIFDVANIGCNEYKYELESSIN